MRRHKHTLSNYRLTTFDMGQLIPVGLWEGLHGDTWQIHQSALLRILPMAAPVMHPIRVRFHTFFFPNRLAWEMTGADGSWEDFITGGVDGRDTSEIPQYVLDSQDTKGGLLDYLGVSPDNVGLSINALPIAMYNAVYNHYYRDQDLVPERAWNDTTIAPIAWEKDRFSGARPWTQKGDDITLPIGERAYVRGLGLDVTRIGADDGPISVSESAPGGPIQYTQSFRGWNDTAGETNIWFNQENGRPAVWADLTGATAATVNDLRRALALQRFQEARARYGSRYTEYLRYYNVTPSDARLDRPEYMGGGTSMMQISEVLQTSPTKEPQREDYGVGDMYGHGVNATRTRRARRFLEEHGYIMTLCSIRPRAIYQDALPKHWTKRAKEDYYQRELEFIGQQEILNKEVKADHALPEGVFGYHDRYRDYRQTESGVSGDFRDTLDYWHMARQLNNTVALNEEFVNCDPTKRIHQVQTENTIWAMINNHAVARRFVKKDARPRIL